MAKYSYKDINQWIQIRPDQVLALFKCYLIQ